MISNTIGVRQREAHAKNARMAFKDNLRRARKAAGLTQEQLGHAVGAAGQSRVSNYEKGIREPTLGEIVALAEALRLHPAELVGWGPVHVSKPDSQPTALDVLSSQPVRPDPAILHEAVTLLLFDLDHGGPRSARSASSLLQELYDRIAAAGGQLPAEEQQAFEDQARARGQKGIVDHERMEQRRRRTGKERK